MPHTRRSLFWSYTYFNYINLNLMHHLSLFIFLMHTCVAGAQAKCAPATTSKFPFPMHTGSVMLKPCPEFPAHNACAVVRVETPVNIFQRVSGRFTQFAIRDRSHRSQIMFVLKCNGIQRIWPATQHFDNQTLIIAKAKAKAFFEYAGQWRKIFF